MLYIKPKQIQCEELVFLKKFLQSGYIENINKNSKYEVSLIHEPYTGYGYADLVCVIWDKSIEQKWTANRNLLQTMDIKILHHLYNCRIYKNISDIITDLGFNQKTVYSSIETLIKSKLIQENKNNKVKIRPINEIFYIKDIISIEAKLLNWKKALEQSVNNTYFASKSFTLLPNKLIHNKILEEYKLTNVGLISFEKNYKIIKKPQRQNIPSTLSSWFFNEHIGRKMWKMA
jgi:predicted transcriptional regulator